jgi:hypothetical protein
MILETLPSPCSVSEIEESMLSSLRPPEHTPLPHRAPLRSDGFSSANHSRPAADPSELPPDRLHVEMEMSPDSQILLYGPLLRALVAIKVQTHVFSSLMNRCYCIKGNPMSTRG